jgi:hypothetical protein
MQQPDAAARRAQQLTRAGDLERKQLADACVDDA